MQRIAFLQIGPGRDEKSDEANRYVWPELIPLFACSRSDELKQRLAAREVDQLWQQHMAPLFEAVPGESSDSFALLQDVFYMPGVTKAI